MPLATQANRRDILLAGKPNRFISGRQPLHIPGEEGDQTQIGHVQE